ncbi:MAG: hypothetical protein KC414_09315 [Romboutsia sp.]|nr:hypothetical protein [Romboutsia sp.]
MFFIIFSFVFSVESNMEKSYTYSKTPKSLFLIKKAKVDADVGEPNLLLSEHQKKNILDDERLEYIP